MSLTKATYSMVDGAAINVLDYGAVPDFNPASGSGTDSRAAIQAAIDAVETTGGTLYFPPGNYYLGSGAVANIAAIELGTYGSGSQVKNIEILAYGATLFLGNVGKVFGIFNCDNVTVKGLSILGYHGGTLGASRQYDHNVALLYNAWNVKFYDCYFAGALGDQLYVGGNNSATAGGQSMNVTLVNTTLKCRIGNGIPSYSGGTGSRNAISIINCIGLDLGETNLILGNADLEPNVSGQYLQDVKIGTRWSNGPVTAEAVVGSNLWYDEPIVTSGTDIETAISAGSPATTGLICSGNVLDNNIFQTGHINVGTHPVLISSISNNSFQKGLIRIASNGYDNLVISGNKAYGNDTVSQTYYGIATNTFISLAAASTNYTRITNNSCVSPSGYCVSLDGAGGDGGYNVFSNNQNLSATSAGVYSFTPSISSYVDYISGTFTPTVVGTGTAGTGTYTGQSGSYVRTGNNVTFQAYVAWNAHTGTGDMYISGLPYATASGTKGRCAVAVFSDVLSYSGQLSAYTNTSETNVYLLQQSSGAGSTLVPIDTAAQIRLSGSYPLA